MENKSNKEILQEIALDEGLENISFGDSSFMVYCGDVLNTETKTGNQYYLLDTYLQIPYTFEPSNLKLHRGIVNEFECDKSNGYRYSGFVHYNGTHFCYGESGVDTLCNIIRDEGLDSDKFNMFLIKFRTYLSTSSHHTMGGGMYRKLDLDNTQFQQETEIHETIEIKGITFPKILKQTTINKVVEKVDYEKPFIKVIKEFTNKSFTFNNQVIIPKIVQHHLVEETKTTEEFIRVNIPEILKDIDSSYLHFKEHEVNNKTRLSIQNFLHQFPNQQRGMDGCLYI